jgi:hypothetical protein
VHPQLLLGLLVRYREYFSAQGFDVGRFRGRNSDYRAICRVLMAPRGGIPAGLFEDLCFVAEMSTPDAMDALLEAARRAGLKLEAGVESTPADVALLVRLTAPHLLEEQHAESFLSRRRIVVDYFKARAGAAAAYRAPSLERLRAFEEELGARLDGMNRGRGCSVLLFERADGVWFLVRRGDARRREGALEGDGSLSVVDLHPKRCDVLRYKESQGELAISVEGHGRKRLVALYRELFGELLFEDRARFPKAAKYTLEPLSAAGEDSLICADVEGIEHVTLTEVEVRQGDTLGSAERLRARDVFELLRLRKRGLPQGRIMRATFMVRFSDARTPRAVTIHPRNVASYTRDSDAGVVERWLIRRGFTQVGTGARDGIAASMLACR